MAITFFTQSKKDSAPIYIRVRELNFDAKARTKLIIKKDRLVKGEIRYYKTVPSDQAQQKDKKQRDNNSLHIIKKEIESLRDLVYDALNSRKEGENITSKWLSDIVQSNAEDKLLNFHIDAFLEFKKLSIKPNTFITYKQSGDSLKGYQKHLKKDVALINADNQFRVSFETYLRERGDANSSIILYIGRLMAILRYAEKLKYKVSDDIKYFKDDLKKKKTLNIYLNLDEIKLINELKIRDERDDIARDWLVISCNTGQRASDLFAFDKKNISKDGNYLTVQQIKNENSRPIEIPLLPQVKEILKKYKGNFPPLFNEIPKTNYTIYNRAIKRVGRLAKIDEVSKTLVTKTSDRKSGVIDMKKYEQFSSHIGRRSFATNMYVKGVSAFWIMNVTGHLTESSFLGYIDQSRAIDKVAQRKAFLEALQ